MLLEFLRNCIIAKIRSEYIAADCASRITVSIMINRYADSLVKISFIFQSAVNSDCKCFFSYPALSQLMNGIQVIRCCIRKHDRFFHDCCKLINVFRIRKQFSHSINRVLHRIFQRNVSFQ